MTHPTPPLRPRTLVASDVNTPEWVKTGSSVTERFEIHNICIYTDAYYICNIPLDTVYAGSKPLRFPIVHLRNDHEGFSLRGPCMPCFESPLIVEAASGTDPVDLYMWSHAKGIFAKGALHSGGWIWQTNSLT